MDYKTYWSILDTPASNIQLSSVSLCIAIGATLFWYLAKKIKKDSGDGDRKIVLWATGSFSVFGIAGYLLLTFLYPDKSNKKALEMLNSPTTPRVEGIVSNFERTVRTTRFGGETIEKFIVGNVQFAYGDAALGRFGSFSQTHNNVIFNGQRVRITYRSRSSYGDNYNSILRLEIAK
ncbi:MAG: hypothetical protein H0X33_10195 [Taibaiella sp.]|nr:hypothetical protein [Taibaiella sp.]